MAAPAKIHFAVAAGAALGSIARHLLAGGMLYALGPGFAWGTLAANMLGSLSIGLYAALTGPGGRWRASPAARQLVMTGFCGGFTTFSIFSLETVLLLERGEQALAAWYVGGSVILWLAAAWLGYRLGASANARLATGQTERPRGNGTY